MSSRLNGGVWLQRALLCFGLLALLAMTLSFRAVHTRIATRSNDKVDKVDKVAPVAQLSMRTTTTTTLGVDNGHTVALTTDSSVAFDNSAWVSLEESFETALLRASDVATQDTDSDENNTDNAEEEVFSDLDQVAPGDDAPSELRMVNGRPLRVLSDRSARIYARKERERQKQIQLLAKANGATAHELYAAKIADAAAQFGDSDVIALAKQLFHRGMIDHRSAEAAGTALATDTDEYVLDLQDMLTSRNFVAGEIEKKEKQGRFEPEGWRTVGVESQIMIELERPFAPHEAGAIEVDITGYDPLQQFTKASDKHHILCLYSRSDGARGGWNDDKKVWLCWRVGKEYVSDSTGAAGTKVQAAGRGSPSLAEIRYEPRRWDARATYTLRIEFDAHVAALFLDGQPLVPLAGQPMTADFADRRETLGYVFVGMDNQTPGFESVRFSNLRIWRRRLTPAQRAALLERGASTSRTALQEVPPIDSPKGVAPADIDRLPNAELLRRLDLMAPTDPSAYGRVHYMISTGNMPGKFGTKYPILPRPQIGVKLHQSYRKLQELDTQLKSVLSLGRLSGPLGEAARNWQSMFDTIGQLGDEDAATLPPMTMPVFTTPAPTPSTTTTTTTTTITAATNPTNQVIKDAPVQQLSTSQVTDALALRAARKAMMEHNKRVRKMRRKQADQMGGGVVWRFDETGALESKDVIVAGGQRVDEHGLKPVDGAWYTNGTGGLRAELPPFMSLLPARHTFVPVDTKSDLPIRSLRFVGINIADGLPGVREKPQAARDRLKRLAEWLRRVQADVVVLWGLGDHGVGMSHVAGDAAPRDGDVWTPAAVRSAAALWNHRYAKRLDTQSGMHLAVTSRFSVEPLVKAGKSFTYGLPDGQRYVSPLTKFFNGAHVVKIDIVDPDDRDAAHARPVYVVAASLDPNSGIARRFEVAAVADSIFDAVPDPERSPVVLFGGFESLSRHDVDHYRALRTIESLRDGMLTEKRALVNTDLGLLYDTMDLLNSFVADVCHRNDTLDASFPTELDDPLVPARFGALRLDYVLTNERAARLHRERARFVPPPPPQPRNMDDRVPEHAAAPLCGAVRDRETRTLSTRYPIIFEMAL